VDKILIVEDEPNARTGLAELIASWGYRTDTAADGIDGLDRVLQWSPSIVITDLKMPRMDGMELLNRIGELPQPVAVIVLTAQGSVESAVEAMRIGAFDYIEKPVDPTHLRTILQSVSRQQTTVAAEPTPEVNTENAGELVAMVGHSPQMQSIFSLIRRIAPTNVSVLITGESGTGKELAARALHELSGRRNKPFIAINCAAIPETLIESEIFGHEKGAFTGALERRAGCFELAEEGTLLLDEIGEMPAATQAKLLRVLEDRKLRRLGSKTETTIDVRVIAATNRDPQTAVAEGSLRGDLFYRLNVFNIEMPSLRDHRDDVPSIVVQMIGEMNARHNCAVTGTDERLMQRLVSYSWPGNVRELRNTVERAVILTGIGDLQLEHLPPNFGEIASLPASPTSSEISADILHLEVGMTVEEAEKQLILRTLTATRNNKTRASEILGISSKTLQNKLKEYSANSQTE